MRNYYPLTAAQKMHHNWILDYGTQQVSGVSVVASVQAELDFGLLKKCIQMETELSLIHISLPGLFSEPFQNLPVPEDRLFHICNAYIIGTDLRS